MPATIPHVKVLPPLAERLWAFFGTLHPAIVHFPIALLTFAAAAVIVRLVFRKFPAEVAFYSLLAGSASAVIAAAMGFAFAKQQGYSGSWFDTQTTEARLLFFHRWVGVGASVAAVIISVLAIKARKNPQRTALAGAWQMGLLATVVATGMVGHWGGQLVYGEGYMEKSLAKIFQNEESAEKKSLAKNANPDAASIPRPLGTPEIVTKIAPGPRVATVDFVAEIKPLLEERCIQCHGQEKKKGGFSMQTRESFFAGGDDGKMVVPGHSDKSALIDWLTKEDEDEVMPPPSKGGPLTEEQIALIKRWIDQGAQWPEDVELEAHPQKTTSMATREMTRG